MSKVNLDFEQAKSKHLLFKARLRSILYDIPVEEGPVLSHYECSVGKWIYGHALQAYGHIPEMHELERVHADIHITARELVGLHKQGKTREAKSGLSAMELVANRLIGLLGTIEQKIAAEPGEQSGAAFPDPGFEEYEELLRGNAELDKRIKQQIEENSEAALKYETVLTALSEGVIIQDAKGILQSANKSAERLLAMGLDQMAAHGSTYVNPDLIYENGEAIPAERYPPMLALSTGLPQVNQLVGIKKENDSVVWLRVNSQPLINKDRNELTGVVSSFFEVTAEISAAEAIKTSYAEQQALNEELASANEEQTAINEELASANEELFANQEHGRELLEQLAESEMRFRFILNAIPQQVWTATPDGALDYVNQVVCDDFGYNTEEIVGHGWQAFIHPDDLPGCLEKWVDSLNNSIEYVIEFRLKFKDGTHRWHLARALPFTENGQVKLWLGTNTNIGLQKNNEQRKDEFLSIASHELKTPLTSIKAYNQILQRIDDPDKLKVFTKKSEGHILRLERLISDLLDVTKINAGKINYVMGPVNIKGLIAGSIESIQYVTDSHKIILLAAPDVYYTGDYLRLEQVLHNFLTNAVKYSPGGKKILVNSKVEDDSIIVSIQDFGIGIAKENLDKLFDRYYRVDNTAMRFEGLGLGLFISAEILRKHGGSFWIESTQGEGSTFYFRLPLNTREKQEVINTDTFYDDGHITITYNKTSKRLDVNWTGFHDMETVQRGCMLMLAFLTNNKCDRVVNDNTCVLGNWSEAADWVGSTWFPLMEKAGLKYLAHVFSPNTFSQLAAIKSIDIMAGIVKTQYFTDVGSAAGWITEQV